MGVLDKTTGKMKICDAEIFQMHPKPSGKTTYSWSMEIENVTKLINRCRISVEKTRQQKKLEWAMHTKESRNDKKRSVC